MQKPYIIIETANTHGGDFDYLTKLVKTFNEYSGNFGIKFQAFHYDGIALPDFSAYEIYKSLHFTKKQWANAILDASKTKDVWLDVFDWYGVDVLKDNYTLIHGIKFQSSVLLNYEVLNAIQEIGLIGKKIILNVAAHPISSIGDIVNRIKEELKPDEVLLEFGYHAYPTSLEDSGLCKIATIRQNFNNRLVFADHVDGKSTDAINLPLVAYTNGVKVIEKHVMLKKPETKFDYYSSLTPDRFKEMVDQLNKYANLFDMPFINYKEKEYLNKTQMIPVLNKPKKAGSVINLNEDFIYRRTSQKGLSLDEVRAIQGKRNVLAVDKKAGETISAEDFRKARIGIVVVCRLHSTRLVHKAIKKIGSLTSVETCIKNVLRFKDVDTVCLATSTEKEDAVLENHIYSPEVKFYKGSPDDVLQRMIDVADLFKLDLVTRVTADTPFPSNSIHQILLNTYFQEGADYTKTINAPLGVNLSVIPTSALKRIKELFPNTSYSEYLAYYFINNPERFKLRDIKLPKDYERSYRLTLDYPEDLELFNLIQNYLDEKNLEADLDNIYNFLDNNKEIAKLNSNMKIKYETDNELIEKLKKQTTLPK